MQAIFKDFLWQYVMFQGPKAGTERKGKVSNCVHGILIVFSRHKTRAVIG